jgi:hypothetical protein
MDSMLFCSEENAIDYLLEQIKPKLKVRFKALLKYDDPNDEKNRNDDFENMFRHSISLGLYGKKRLVDLYFKKDKKVNAHKDYWIQQVPEYQAKSVTAKTLH